MTKFPGFEVSFFFFFLVERERACLREIYEFYILKLAHKENQPSIIFYYYIRVVLEIVRIDFTTKCVTNHKIIKKFKIFIFLFIKNYFLFIG